MCWACAPSTWRCIGLRLITRVATADGWDSMPPVVHLVDRGDPDSHSSDIGAMELYAAAVVGADPFAVADALREGLPA